MAYQLEPTAKFDPPYPTVITVIGDDLLREIFLRLPSLARAALACPAFLNAIRSSPAFCRRFQTLHPPQLLGLFVGCSHHDIPPFVLLHRRSDLDLAAAVRGSDFLLTRLPQDSWDQGWVIMECRSGYVLLHNQRTRQIAAYNFDTLTLQLSRMDLPPPIQHASSTMFKLGRSKDGNLCMVDFDGDDNDGVEKWMLDKIFPLDTCLNAVVQPALYMVRIVAVIDGLVYLSIDLDGYVQCRLISFCLETKTLNKLLEDTFDRHIHPYIMAWPPTLVCNKIIGQLHRW